MGREKGFVNIKHNLDLLINAMSETLHFFTSHSQRNSQTFPVFHLIDPMNAWSAPPSSLTTEAIVQVSLHAFICHPPCISNAGHSLKLRRRSKFVFCNKTLMSPNRQISTPCDFKWEEGCET